MTLNFPGPAEVRINYLVNTRPHQVRLSFVPDGPLVGGMLYDGINAVNHANTVDPLVDHTDAFLLDFVKAFNSSDMTTVDIEVWEYAPFSFDATFITSTPAVNAGTNANPTVPAGQLIYSFRTLNGGIAKLVLMETGFGAGASIPPPWVGSHGDLITEMTDSLGIWKARDGSRPLVCVGVHPGQNERLFKKIYRS